MVGVIAGMASLKHLLSFEITSFILKIILDVFGCRIRMEELCFSRKKSGGLAQKH
jgi:hypothetical protein